ncbi:MAG TPA: SdpI family protein [Caulobacteraceae bacterium]|jgi:uncharacterized membrane protein
MTLQRPLMLALVLILAAAIVGAWAFRLLPAGAVIPVHFNIHGDADGFLPKGPGLAVLPVVGVLVLLLMAFLPRLAPRARGFADAAGPYGVVLIGVAAMFLVAEAAVAMRGLDPAFDVLRWLFLALGVLFAVIGNLLGKVRQNSVLGIRTPWTLRDKRVWDKTHRFTGRLMVLGGVLLAVVALIGDHTDLIVALIVCAGGPAIAGIVYSRAIAQAEPAKG